MTQQPLVDDEVAIQRAVGPLLRARGYDVEIAGTGAEALSMVARQTPDLIVLDLGLPDLEGTEVCPGVRAASNVPIVVLSARGAEADKVNALDLGADDYVTKPFGPEELLARIRVALRRVPPEAGGASGQFRAGDLTLDYDRYRVLRNETEIRLTPKEFELLSLLARNHDRVLTPRHPQGCLGPERRRAAGAPVDARRPASQEDRAGPGPSTVLAERAMGRLSLCER
jgi:two-component system KDP operon response regulator KdpE